MLATYWDSNYFSV